LFKILEANRTCKFSLELAYFIVQDLYPPFVDRESITIQEEEGIIIGSILAKVAYQGSEAGRMMTGHTDPSCPLNLDDSSLFTEMATIFARNADDVVEVFRRSVQIAELEPEPTLLQWAIAQEY